LLDASPEVHVQCFDGPLALLLELIERRRLEITQISLAAVADQYLDAVRALARPAPDLLAEFVAIASRLLLIKSRALLPRLAAELDEDDSAVNLEMRLAEYRLVRAAAEQLQRIELRDLQSHPGAVRKLTEGVPDLQPVAVGELRRLALHVLTRKAASDASKPMVTDERPTAESRARLVLERIAAQQRVAWSDVAGPSRDTIVATFLAVLELFKRNLLRLEQELPFGDLWLLAPLDSSSVSLDRSAVGRETQQA
jgi:segregation and condensation protein A